LTRRRILIFLRRFRASGGALALANVEESVPKIDTRKSLALTACLEPEKTDNFSIKQTEIPAFPTYGLKVEAAKCTHADNFDQQLRADWFRSFRRKNLLQFADTLLV
jgi:hypothetical protein